MQNARSMKLFGILLQPTWRVGGTRMSLPISPRRRGQRGRTLIEVLTVVAIAGTIVGTAAMRMPRRAYALLGANQQLLVDLRRTRADALIKGDHFRLEITSPTSYAEYRLKLVNNAWSISGAPVYVRTLPPNVAITADVSQRFEFNTRGLLIRPDQAASLVLTDTYTGHTRRITVWPSGQVAPI
jgi:prepilin-type N-terminal cleavage/methylation domain-containing protein